MRLVRRATLCLIVLGVAACRDADVTTVAVDDARGTPFRSSTPAEPAPEAAPPPLPAPAPSTPVAAGVAQVVTLKYLSDYPYDSPGLKFDAEGRPIPVKVEVDPVPKAIRELSGKRISVEGYIIPFDYADGTCTKFAVSISRQYCCFGCTNRVNTYIEIEMAPGRRADCDTSETVRVEGVLTVHRIEEEVSPLYTMVGEVVVPLE
jgi:hypothetical protein